MTHALRSADSLTAHAVCMAAGLRDGLRTAQFYVRDMSNADAPLENAKTRATPLSRLVAGVARFADRFLSRAADISIRLLLPQWRNLPSPFAPRMVEEVTDAIRQNRLVMTSLFTAYFFRASRHILDRCAEPPFLVLEHRIDAARRTLAERPEPVAPRSQIREVSEVLLALAESRSIARIGKAKSGYPFLETADPNIAVMAAACLALVLAEDGKPLESLDEDEFLAIAGALLTPRLPAMERAIKARDINILSRELEAVRELY